MVVVVRTDEGRLPSLVDSVLGQSHIARAERQNFSHFNRANMRGFETKLLSEVSYLRNYECKQTYKNVPPACRSHQ